jgi:hypothetical protein
MTKMSSPPPIEPVALSDDVTGMADYVRGSKGRSAIARGLLDVEEDRVLIGENALLRELRRRASSRRNKK